MSHLLLTSELWPLVKSLWPVLVLCVVAIVVAEVLKGLLPGRRGGGGGRRWRRRREGYGEEAPQDARPEETTPWTSPFRKRDYLLSVPERTLYDALLWATAGRYVVFAKVRLLDLLYLPSATPGSQGHLNRVQSKHVDFVLCRPDTLGPAVVIELDDASHQRPDRIERDALVDHVLATARLPVLHVPLSRAYDPNMLLHSIDQAVAAR